MLQKIRSYIRQGGWPFITLCMALLICNRNGYISLMGVFVILVGMIPDVRRKIDMTGVGLIFYSLTYLMISTLNGTEYTIHSIFLYGLAPFFFYSYGKIVPYKWKDEDKVIIFILIIVFCYCLDIFYITIKNIITSGELINLSRDFSFNGETEIGKAATLIGLPMDIAMVGLPIFIISKNRPYRFLFLLLSLLALLVTFHLLNRTGLIVLMLCTIGLIGWKSRKKPIMILTSLVILFVLYFILQSLGVLSDELLLYYTSRNEDLSTMGDRSYRWLFALQQLFIHPLGWANSGEVYYVHNMWLDIARISGIIPFILLLVFTISGFINSFRYVRKRDSILSYLLLGLNICFFASCFVEPIYGGTHFLLYCMLWGLLNTLSNKNILL